MSASIEQLANRNVVVVRYALPFNAHVDLTYVKTELEKLLESTRGTVNVIVDFDRINLTFADLVLSMGETVDPESETAAQRGRLVFTLVGSDALIQMAAEAYAQEQYGGMRVDLFPSVEAAIDHIEQQV